MGRIAIVTGASGTIGKAVADGLEADGMTVLRVARKEAPYHCDVTRRYQVAQVVADALVAHGSVDVLVNAAGVAGETCNFHRASIEQAHATLDTNLFGTMQMTTAVLEWMLRRKFGRIVNFAGGGIGGPALATHRAAYVASKFGVVGFTEALSGELSYGCGVTVNCVSPGKVASQMTGYVGGAPLSVVKLVRWLASKESAHINGRLISAVWDTWDALEPNSDDWRLRRIDGKLYGRKS